MAKAKPLEVGSIARIVFVISICMARGSADSLPFLFLRFESLPPPCDLFRDLLAPAAKECADGNAKSGLVSKPGLKGRGAGAGFVARYLYARRSAEEIGKFRLAQVCMPAISAEVVIKWPSVNVFHGSTKKRRLAGSSVESGYVSGNFRREEGSERKLRELILHAAESSRSESNFTPTLYVNVTYMSSDKRKGFDAYRFDRRPKKRPQDCFLGLIRMELV
jgi:hypothetical protein